MWSKISSALKPREGNDSDADHSDAQSTARNSPPDPFRINATTYYTHQTPPTPPPGSHSRTASREEDIIWSLRTQLALQQELCAQFEIDLGARDELVEALTIRLEASERENEKRKNVVRSWKKKAAELERMCRHLEREVDNGRQESMERSIMDEASGEALRQLHRQISQLEREKSDVQAERDALARSVSDVEAEMIGLREKLGDTDAANGETIRQLRHQISKLEREKTDLQAEGDALVQAKRQADAKAFRMQEELETAGRMHNEVQCRLHAQISQLEREKSEIDMQRTSWVQAKEEADAETLRLKEELDALNETNREALLRLHDQISQLEREKSEDDLSSEVARLRAHIHQLQKDSAVMEVTIVQLNKQLDQDKEDIGGLNIALESKQQELELVKRKHGVRSSGSSTSSRASLAPSTVGKPVGNSVPSTGMRTSAVGTRTSSPVPLRVPSTLGRAANTKPPVSGGLRRASSLIAESKTKLTNRRLSVTSSPSEADEKENASTPIPPKHQRRTMVLA